jgi:hypothetical protein
MIRDWRFRLRTHAAIASRSRSCLTIATLDIETDRKLRCFASFFYKHFFVFQKSAHRTRFIQISDSQFARLRWKMKKEEMKESRFRVDVVMAKLIYEIVTYVTNK